MELWLSGYQSAESLALEREKMNIESGGSGKKNPLGPTRKVMVLAMMDGELI